ncbi:MAG: hypothetical protein ACMUEL_09170 [Flavobacteriales bacterium Tduv]
MSKPRWVVERPFDIIKRSFRLSKVSLQRISSCVCPASYGGYGS